MSGDRKAILWEVLSASARGAAHVSSGLPMQDAVRLVGDPEREDSVLVVAVADGHGDRRHFRSNVGSDYAVQVAGNVGQAFGARVGSLARAEEVTSAVREELIPAAEERWRIAVTDHLESNPIEVAIEAPNVNDLIPYGTTLLIAVVAFPWLVLCQIGDGDIVVANELSVEVPVPSDESLDGLHTTSLCQVDAVEAFRHAVIDLRHQPADVVLLATDGFGNSQVADPWYGSVGVDIVRMARDHGIDWLRAQLPLWVERCASAEGSTDDTTVGLLVRRGLAIAHLSTQPGASGKTTRLVVPPTSRG